MQRIERRSCRTPLVYIDATPSSIVRLSPPSIPKDILLTASRHPHMSQRSRAGYCYRENEIGDGNRVDYIQLY